MKVLLILLVDRGPDPPLLVSCVCFCPDVVFIPTFRFYSEIIGNPQMFVCLLDI